MVSEEMSASENEILSAAISGVPTSYDRHVACKPQLRPGPQLERKRLSKPEMKRHQLGKAKTA
jgi:hypothetical protein